MGLRRYGTFTGGIHLPDQKSVTGGRAITPAPKPSSLRVPLRPARGPLARPVVRAGQTVEAGEMLAEAPGPDGVPVFAPMAGRVASVEAPAAVASAGGFELCPAVELVELGDWPSLALLRGRGGWLDRLREELQDQLRRGGLRTHRHPVEPLSAWLDRAAAARCDVLIANAVEDQPYVAAEHRLLAEHGAAVIGGLAALGRILGAGRVMLAVDGRRTGSYRGLAHAAHRHHIATLAVPPKYPTGTDALLVKVLTRRKVPPGGTPLDVAAAVIDPTSCFAVFRWLACGQRVLGRVVTVAGERLEAAENYWTPLGYPCAELAGGVQPLIHGGPMVGLRDSAHSVVTAGTCALLAIDEAPSAVPTPCIRCGWCTDNCPARLNVAILNDDFELGQIDHARRLGVAACLACGVCSYVCPARLPLAGRVWQLKQATAEPVTEAAP